MPSKKPEAFAVEKDGAWWAAVEFAGPFANNAECWREIDRKRTTRINDHAEEIRRATQLLNDALDELGYARRSPGEYPLRREIVERLEENVTRAVRLLTEIEMFRLTA